MMSDVEAPADGHERTERAVAAMEELGLPRKCVVKTLKRLHKELSLEQVYEDQIWEMIEMEEYRLLANTAYDYVEKRENRAREADASSTLARPRDTREGEAPTDTSRPRDAREGEAPTHPSRPRVTREGQAPTHFSKLRDTREGEAPTHPSTLQESRAREAAVKCTPAKPKDTKEGEAPTNPQLTVSKATKTNGYPQMSETSLKVLATSIITKEEEARTGQIRRAESIKNPPPVQRPSPLLHSRGGVTPRTSEAGRGVKRLDQSDSSPTTRRPEDHVVHKKLKQPRKEPDPPASRRKPVSSQGCKKLKRPQQEVEATQLATDKQPNGGDWEEEEGRRHNAEDLSRGEEAIPIPIVNDSNSKTLPPSFFYISSSKVHEKAHVNISIARMGDDNCCPNCYKDCLTAPYPCACARDTGGEYAYTPDGCLHERYIEKAMRNKLDDTTRVKHYCVSGFHCPEERFKNEENPGKCKGHLVRDFVKECSCRCGCSKWCGNRVVQRGISRRLEVFWTREGKGWGIRSLEDLPAGAFVFEYVGEILTNTEMYYRNEDIIEKKNGVHSYPVLLDGDWGSEAILKDEEALCLDATYFGNIARFLNHRCQDANLLDMPVEIETPDRHYYHVAFFTNRPVKAREELTWVCGFFQPNLDQTPPWLHMK